MSGSSVADGSSGCMSEGSSLVSRRTLLRSSALAGAVAAMAACSAKGSKHAAPSTSSPSATTRPADDARAAAYAAGLEVLALRTYASAVQAVSAGATPAPPNALGQLINLAAVQHQQHLDAWNASLRSAGKPEVTEPPASLSQALQANLQGILSAGVGRTALSVEQLVAASYVSAVPSLQATDAIRLAASIHVVEIQHVALIRFLLNQNPAPDAFANDAFSLGD